MKRLFRILTVTILLLSVGCIDDDLFNRLDNLEERVSRLEELCREMNTNISSLQTIVTALQTNDYVTAVTPIVEDGKTVGYTISFVKSDPITLYHGKDGADGKDGIDGYNPVIGVRKDSDGCYYWTSPDGNWLLDESGNKIQVQDIDKKPLLKIENEYWYISYDNGETWVQLSKYSNINSVFVNVSEDNDNVYIDLADGTIITLPKGTALNITFDEADLVVMLAKSTRSIGYTVSSMTDKVTVEVTSSADIKAKVIPTDNSGMTGSIQVITGDSIDEYSKVIVFVSNGDKVIMRSITFEEVGLVVKENTTKKAPAEGGEVVLEFLTNVKCVASIPQYAQSWISVVPATRALDEQYIILQLEPNTSTNRSSEIVVQSLDGLVSVVYYIEQEGEIDISAIPDNEIWYTSVLNRKIVPNTTNFGARLVENEYKDGLGIMTFDGPVTMISSGAFENFEVEATQDLSAIYLPSKVEVIGEGAFYRCKNLKVITLPPSLKEIGDQAFMYTGLLEIDIPHSVERFGLCIMQCCDKLKRIESKYSSEDKRCLIIDGILNSFAPSGLSTQYELPNTITEIGYGVFCEVRNLQNIILPNSLRVIGDRAFDGAGLSHIDIPEGVVEIGTWAFRGNDFETIHFPSTLELLGENVIGGCEKLKSITGKFATSDSKGLLVDGKMIAIASCGLTDYVFPSDVHTIGEDILWGNKTIESIRIPEGVRMIETGAFFGCDNLRYIEIPSSIESFGYRALTHCDKLEHIRGAYATDDGRCLIKDGKMEAFAPWGLSSYTIPSGVKEIRSSAISSYELKEIVLPEGLEIICEDAFRICPVLTSITIPSTVKSIGNFCGALHEIFYSCKSLAKIVCKAVLPPDLLVPIVTETPIYVPKKSLEAYQRHHQWGAYSERIHAINEDENLYVSTDYSKDGTVVKLQTATVGEGIDIVLMGDAYSDRQIADGAYRTDMEFIYNNFFTEEPYKSFKDYFNVYYVNVVSKNEGYGALNESALGSYVNVNIAGGNDNVVFDYAQKAIPAGHMDEALLIVVMNSDAYAGTCYMYYPDINAGYGNGVSVAYFPRGGNATTFAQVLHHEACGHGFAKLADEYAYDGYIPLYLVEHYALYQKIAGWWKNVDFTNDLSQIRWSHFLNDSRYQYDGLGAYEGGLTYGSGVWRPTENSIMRYITGGFNAPSREAIYYRIHKLAYGNSWQYDYEEFVEWDARNRKTEAEMSRAPYRAPANFKHTAPPVVIKGSWRDAKPKEK